VLAALASALFVFVVACAAVGVPSAPTTTLVVWVDTPAIGASIKQRLGAFTRDHPNVQVKVFDQFQKIQNGDVSIAIEALTNSALSPDVVALTDQDFRLMSNRGDLMNLGPYIIQDPEFDPTDFFGNAWEVYRDRGKQYAIPSEVVPWVVFYNKDLFDKAKVAYPDSSWNTSQFVADGVQVAEEANDKNEVSGFVADPTTAIFPFVESFGVIPGDASDDPYAKWLDDKRSAEALQWFANLGLLQKITPIDPSNRAVGLWYFGRAGMAGLFMDQRQQIPSYLRRDNVAALTPTVTGTPLPPAGWKFAWGVTSVPKAEVQASVYYVSGYGIPQSSHDPDDAWLLIEYLTSHLPERPGQAYVPARESLAYSKAFADLYPETGHEVYVESVQVGRPLPAYPPAARPTNDDLAGVLAGTVHPSTALQAYRDRVQPVIKPRPTPTPTPYGYTAPSQIGP
jgi:multiple sugar transport system substrate-binding protein